eukprot:1481009-Rhodomonas_salina.1
MVLCLLCTLRLYGLSQSRTSRSGSYLTAGHPPLIKCYLSTGHRLLCAISVPDIAYYVLSQYRTSLVKCYLSTGHRLLSAISVPDIAYQVLSQYRTSLVKCYLSTGHRVTGHGIAPPDTIKWNARNP